MVQIIPAIIAKSFEELQEKIDKVSPYSDWAQIDVSDGIYTPNVTWNNPKELPNLKTNLNLEIHLMINNPENHITDWVKAGAKRIIVHINSKNDYQKINKISEILKNKNVQLAIALNPNISVEEIQNLIPLADTILLLAVTPGFSGQMIQPIILEKIKKLRELFPGVKIEVDGGINPETAKECIKFGADILVSQNYIFSSNNIKEAIESLKK